MAPVTWHYITVLKDFFYCAESRSIFLSGKEFLWIQDRNLPKTLEFAGVSPFLDVRESPLFVFAKSSV
ncbi:hypothetical protein LEP1GSC060_0161 [Leptospira weilii serovar Ranarum str. ICFT]|uniref:Uncharacterized protein n=1 Tax=Leptospira weilii serovar Ranarum str. ICFT TaxID=1218598 RepID=N1WJL8_9LEPT|nr:hypothetical protein LEP1GSC060_0161 [Leptospira weilii serovar Ranarum str. ICFT]